MGEYKDRLYPRVEVSVTVDINAEDVLLYHRIENISLGGVCVKTSSLEPVGSRVEVVVNMPDSQDELEVMGEVVWTSDQPDSKMGIRFLDMNDTVKETLRTFLYKQQ